MSNFASLAMSAGTYEQPTLSLEQACRNIGMEAGILDNLMQSFSRLIPSANEKMHELYSGLTGEGSHPEFKKFKANYAEVQPELKHMQYGNFRERLTSVPEGFSGEFVTFAKFVNEHLQDLHNVAISELDHFTTLISTFMSNKENKLALTDISHRYEPIGEFREGLQHKLSDFYKTTTSSMAPIKKVLPRIFDITELRDELVKLERLLDRRTLDTVNNKLAKVCSLLAELNKSVRNNGVEEVSGAAAKNISDAIYQLAKLVELVSVFRFKTENFITSCTALVEVLNNKKVA